MCISKPSVGLLLYIIAIELYRLNNNTIEHASHEIEKLFQASSNRRSGATAKTWAFINVYRDYSTDRTIETTRLLHNDRLFGNLCHLSYVSVTLRNIYNVGNRV